MQCVTLEIKNLHGCLSWYVRQPLEECDPKIGSFLSSTLKAIESWIWFILRSVLCGTLQTLPSLTLWYTWTGQKSCKEMKLILIFFSLQDDQWRERIHEELLRKMAENPKLLTDKNPSCDCWKFPVFQGHSVEAFLWAHSGLLGWGTVEAEITSSNLCQHHQTYAR